RGGRARSRPRSRSATGRQRASPSVPGAKCQVLSGGRLLRGFVDYSASDDCGNWRGSEQVTGGNVEDWFGQDHEIRKVACREPALSGFGELRIGGSGGIELDGLRQREALFGKP